MSTDSGSGWFVEADGTLAELEDEANYDESRGPVDPHAKLGRLVEDDEGAHEDTTAEAVASRTEDSTDLSAEEAAVHIMDR